MVDDQELFLIEFLVDKVQIPMIRAMQEELLPACTCVSFQILSLPPIDICQEALTDGCGCTEGDTQVFKKGKSCLFALPSIVLQRPLTTFPIKMSVYKKLPPGVLPDVMLVGCHQIEAKALINAVLSQQVFKIANPCQTIKDTFKITTATGQCVGSVTVYIRTSCFGKKIITQFQIPHNRKPYLFKGADESPVFQCKKIPSECYTQVPLKCTCAKKCNDGSGEAAGKTCCPTPVVQAGPVPDKPKLPDCGPRPCCPSRRSSPGYTSFCRLSHSESFLCMYIYIFFLLTTYTNLLLISNRQPLTCSPCSPQSRQKAQPPAASPCCCSQAEKMFGAIRAAAQEEGKCGPPVQQSPCPPCCAPSSPMASKGYKDFSDLFGKETNVKKCGCPVKEYSCTCSKSK
ncbi:hypothetical protein ANTQUA_LOCUS1372, partial [Anthophora quadrimaculata]